MNEAANLTVRQLSCIPDVHFDLIPIRNLVSNQEYQRMLSETHITKIIQDFDVYQVNPVKISRRNGQNYVFDGQHTIEVIAAVSGSRDTPVWCMVYDDLEYREEAHIFAEQQKHVKALVPYEMFTAHVEAGDNKQMMIHNLVTNVFKLKISGSRAPGTISAVSALEFIFDRYGYEVLERTLGLSLSTWEGEDLSLSSSILKAIAMMVSAYGDKLDDETFRDRVSKFSPKAVCRNARDRRPGIYGYVESLLIIYNGKNKKKLNIRKLFWSNGRRASPPPPDFVTDG